MLIIKRLANELDIISQEQPMELILPCLFSELEADALKNIIQSINKTKLFKPCNNRFR